MTPPPVAIPDRTSPHTTLPLSLASPLLPSLVAPPCPSFAPPTRLVAPTCLVAPTRFIAPPSPFSSSSLSLPMRRPFRHSLSLWPYPLKFSATVPIVRSQLEATRSTRRNAKCVLTSSGTSRSTPMPSWSSRPSSILTFVTLLGSTYSLSLSTRRPFPRMLSAVPRSLNLASPPPCH